MDGVTRIRRGLRVDRQDGEIRFDLGTRHEKKSNGVRICSDRLCHCLRAVDDPRRGAGVASKDGAEPPLRIVDVGHADETIEEDMTLRRVCWTHEKNDAMSIVPAADLA